MHSKKKNPCAKILSLLPLLIPPLLCHAGRDGDSKSSTKFSWWHKQRLCSFLSNPSHWSGYTAVSLFLNTINLVEHLASRLLVKQYTRLPPKRCVFNKSPSPHAVIASDLCKKKKKKKWNTEKKLRFLRWIVSLCFFYILANYALIIIFFFLHLTIRCCLKYWL